MPTTTTPAAVDRALPTDRVWVLKLHAGPLLVGCIEHVVSGAQRAFNGPAELLDVLMDADQCLSNHTTENKP